LRQVAAHCCHRSSFVVIASHCCHRFPFVCHSAAQRRNLLLPALFVLYSSKPQKYISKKRKILDREKVSAKHHDLPRNSPQTHHDLPSKNTTKTRKPPEKATLHHKNIFLTQQPQNPSG
jgi:hypothetical protein